jgi:toxin ParE1/3/4
MPPFKLTKKAMDDLIGIARYTEQTWGREQRRQYLKKLDSMFYTLADNPGIGRSCDDIRPGYFKQQEGSHLIFYRRGTFSKIEIIRVLHKRMDVALHL